MSSLIQMRRSMQMIHPTFSTMSTKPKHTPDTLHTEKDQYAKLIKGSSAYLERETRTVAGRSQKCRVLATDAHQANKGDKQGEDVDGKD